MIKPAILLAGAFSYAAFGRAVTELCGGRA